MSFFSTLAEFGGWHETSRESLDAKELKTIASAEVKERHAKDGSTFNVIVFTLKSGKTKSHYLSKLSDLQVGDKVDPKSVEFIHLEDEDGSTSVKVDGEIL